MYIAPQTNLKIYRNVPLDRNHVNSLDFNSLESQISYFAQHLAYSFENLSYIRAQRTIRVEINPDELLNCNYLSYNNRAFGYKEIYAFITEVAYISNQTAEISFDVDVLQTWMTEFSLLTCFVEREHVADDTIGKHLLPEPIRQIEDLPMEESHYYFTDWKVLIQATTNSINDETGEGAANGTIIDNQYSGAQFYICNLNASAINSTIDELLRNSYQIINVFGAPEELLNAGIPAVSNVPKRPTSFHKAFIPEEPYIPKNNKLFTYPFTYLQVNSSEGVSVSYRWEDMSADGSMGFRLYRSRANTISCTLTPFAYRGVADAKEYAITLNSFPTYGWSENSVSQFIGNGGIIKAVSQLGSAMINDAATAAATGVVIPVNTVLAGADLASIAFTPKSYKGNASNGLVDISHDQFGFTFLQMGMRADDAKRIDGYFDRYGYRVDEFKVPDYKTREFYNYVKTRDCRIRGNIPQAAIDEIESIFNNGVTFWHHTNAVADYSVDNRAKVR